MVQPFLRRQKAILFLDPICCGGVVYPHTLVGNGQGRCQGKDEAENEQSCFHEFLRVVLGILLGGGTRPPAAKGKLIILRRSHFHAKRRLETVAGLAYKRKLPCRSLLRGRAT